MLDIDIDAFFQEQDERMNEPDDDTDEFLARMAKMRSQVPDFFALDISSDRTPSNSVPEPSYDDLPSDDSTRPSNGSATLTSAKGKEIASEFLAPTSSKRSTGEDEGLQMMAVFPRKSPRRHNTTPLRTSPPPSIPRVADSKPEASLKRKQSPTKPQKPPRKKAVVDQSVQPSSPIEVSPKPVSKPIPRKPKSSDKAARPSAKTPPRARAPETIDLSMSPIEEPDFSVLVSRFEPEAMSTQPKVAAAPSMFLQMKERVEKQSRERNLRRASKSNAKVAGPSIAGPSDPISGDESIILVSSSPSRQSSPEPNAIHPIKVTTKPKGKAKPQPAAHPKPRPSKKGKKERVKMYPKDFAQMLKDTPPPPVKEKQFLKGKNIFYTGGDMSWASEGTMGRMKIIVERGGNLCPVFDRSLVTHIITQTTEAPLLRALGVKKFSEIPDHIPIIRWKWVADGMDGAAGPLFEYAAYAFRVPPVDMPGRTAKGKGKQRASSDASADLSRISDFTQDRKRKRTLNNSEDDEPAEKPSPRAGALISPPASPVHKVQTGEASSSGIKVENNDPLAEFYAQARAERDAELWSRPGEAEGPDDSDSEGEGASDTDNEDIQDPGPAPKRGWTCDNKEAQRKNGPNEMVAKKLEELMHLHKAKPGDDNHWRGLSYQKAVRAIRNYPYRIKSFNQALTIRGVAKKTALKIMEIIETGDLRRIQYENTPDVQVRKIFQDIYGAGQVTAYKWYAAGCRTLDDLLAGKGGVTLTEAQKIGIQFYDDINDRMPREEAKALFDLIKPIALGIDPKLEIQIMGSYRRGKADCGDIDIMITRCPDDGKTHAGILHHLLEALHEAKILTEDLALPEDPFGDEAIYRGLCRLPQFGSRRRRIDFLTIPWKSRGAALLYYTGDDIFNRCIRLKANKLGYSLNQKGLFAGVIRDPRNRTIKLNTGNLVASETEQEIFRLLDVPYQEPHERVRG
ncbi:DNA polymerase lambda [Mycena maculata]|uniref:DNA-directed DNA polymerase n=1 Tax=Mycena maculata TaxID=230809 RepID=A0AAD7MSM5_9AGAR|nr:DNA polymerase lambda [Mycena maculata]